ncbi:hypothetical protein [Sphingomonas sp. SKA58]|uniref:hypothetical protein n=1 Tax=Sphingomonas sp. (strain SKA58) TaxID=314266 RepID=UPI0012EAFA6D|nr:hypothetical protein [Sphingomonas sp. SKA58]
MKDALDRIIDRLTAQGFTVEEDGLVASTYHRWFVTFPSEETCFSLLIEEDPNGHPRFWTQCPTTGSTEYITPLFIKIGDIRDEIVGQSIARARLA